MSMAEQQHFEVMDDLSHIMACHPDMSIDELNIVAQHKVNKLNNRPMEHFFGLTPAQMTNWLYAPLDTLTGVSINTPDDVTASPVMRCLEIILEEAMAQGGSFKATAKGNLPTKLVARASALRLELLINKSSTNISISEYAGSNEDKFNALHYSRVLAQLSGIIYLRAGRFHVKKRHKNALIKKGFKRSFCPC
ncbi:hypothetical protein [Thiomicrorhabdus aquaedulcis]|uniref:hypothetical protein n=1 Tax=Thiomicrorhabdus aquaedulcis TaxID=2211106 RepID=UPI001E5837B9|nr:hypothetical protein [Thiomicrorhabdus aquaedulcis]